MAFPATEGSELQRLNFHIQSPEMGSVNEITTVGVDLAKWVVSLCGEVRTRVRGTVNSTAYVTHSIRRAKPTLIYRRTKNLMVVQLPLGHTKLESTVRCLGIEDGDSPEPSEQTEVCRFAGRTDAGERWTGPKKSFSQPLAATNGFWPLTYNCAPGGIERSIGKAKRVVDKRPKG
jgi:hypothetical protein